MKPPVFRIILGFAIVLAARPSAAGDEPTSVRINLQVFRVLGDFSGDLSLTDDIWTGIDGPKLETKRAFTFFTQGKVSLANARLSAGDNGWIWNEEKEIPFGASADQASILGDRVALIAMPVVLVNLGQSASIKLESEQTLEYFERARGNLFELKTTRQPTGLTFNMQVENQEGGRILLKDFTVSSRIVEGRKPIEGVSLNVGEPILKSRELKATISVRPAKDYGIVIHAPDMQGLLLIRLNADYAPKDSKDIKDLKDTKDAKDTNNDAGDTR